LEMCENVEIVSVEIAFDFQYYQNYYFATTIFLELTTITSTTEIRLSKLYVDSYARIVGRQ
jgi:hypothetical protein